MFVFVGSSAAPKYMMSVFFCFVLCVCVCVFSTTLCSNKSCVVWAEKIIAGADCPWRFMYNWQMLFVKHTHLVTQLVNAIPARVYIVFVLLPRRDCVYKNHGNHATSVCGYCLTEAQGMCACFCVCSCTHVDTGVLNRNPSDWFQAWKPKDAVVSSAVFVWVVFNCQDREDFVSSQRWQPKHFLTACLFLSVLSFLFWIWVKLSQPDVVGC